MSEFEALAEEQAMEAEALESIFVDEFEQLSESPYHWKVKLQPFPAEDEENHVIASLEAKIPKEYPNIVPELIISTLKGLTDEQIDILTEIANKSAEDNIGMAMIYTICEEIKEWLLAHNEPPQDNSMFAKMQRRIHEKDAPVTTTDDSGEVKVVLSEAQSRELEALERNRQKELEGTPVNSETFATWKASFDASQTIAVVISSDKKTGREYFSVGANVEEWKEPEENEGAEEEGDDDFIHDDDVFNEDDYPDSDFSDLDDLDDDEDAE
mmetsp:Transcript_36908/g.47701  ORF Transcript_36908/g.47701 Transcript_36908/m.47701 type:complete len:269 (-) Transcript_36908:140-946(-)|eukprot:CAMPEP_0114346450 /NCGR_PEP_ID=MMETSP0101-20121206/13072_1 /TAXON_ID=38822 ORGANISM="Pteridomonas danica, Strain PT" /NCGR_SAMPLE_ID=MMETSP0101 /ASSEMBLY_ACC=CAM_ASM_000211 /LENGTH=268 /DNA_ID=CAMNT_0001483091 /DNA_START=21 /DNA_END=827 /DNA_ORIENTATION=+